MKLANTRDPTRFYTAIVAGLCLGLLTLIVLLVFLGPAEESMSDEDRAWAISTVNCLASQGVDIDPLSTDDLEWVIAERDERGIGSFPHDCGRWTTIEGD
jgi:hypothetical protein